MKKINFLIYSVLFVMMILLSSILFVSLYTTKEYNQPIDKEKLVLNSLSYCNNLNYTNALISIENNRVMCYDINNKSKYKIINLSNIYKIKN